MDELNGINTAIGNVLGFFFAPVASGAALATGTDSPGSQLAAGLGAVDTTAAAAIDASSFGDWLSGLQPWLIAAGLLLALFLVVALVHEVREV